MKYLGNATDLVLVVRTYVFLLHVHSITVRIKQITVLREN